MLTNEIILAISERDTKYHEECSSLDFHLPKRMSLRRHPWPCLTQK